MDLQAPKSELSGSVVPRAMLSFVRSPDFKRILTFLSENLKATEYEKKALKISHRSRADEFKSYTMYVVNLDGWIFSQIFPQPRNKNVQTPAHEIIVLAPKRLQELKIA